MTTLGYRIKHIREEMLHLNQTDFAEKMGFSRTATISDYEKDKRAPDIAVLRKIASLGAVKIEWLLTGEGPISIYDAVESARTVMEGRRAAYGETFMEVKVYNTAAGTPENFPSGEPAASLFVPKSAYEKAPVAVRIEGDSMSPNILSGAIVGIDTKDRKLVSGKLYAIWLNYEGVTIKRVFVYPDRMVLKPDNPAFPETSIPAKSPGEQFIIGRVVWVYQML